jgi:hypothetical protein
MAFCAAPFRDHVRTDRFLAKIFIRCSVCNAKKRLESARIAHFHRRDKVSKIRHFNVESPAMCEFPMMWNVHVYSHW